MNFPVRSLILPRTQASGYVFTSRSEQVKAVDVDLVGDDFSQNFTFFAPNPNSTGVSLRGILHKTDGLRVVLAFGDRPASLGSIDFFDWERLVD
jgi:hypothetical protein